MKINADSGQQVASSDIVEIELESDQAPIIFKKTKLRLENPYAEVAYTDNNLLDDETTGGEDLETAEAVSDVFVRSNNFKDDILNSLEEKSKIFEIEAVPKSSKTEILSGKQD